ncbi:hypothetical protein BHK69_14975 [Bosea vaviloviae]|uniref:Uncharacterized protein n=2 Tax=Boseaceae TaxID=2831100 RepID=A0A1D7U2I7_9HYPH|nr:hypothetical protein BHK69_14975 [Bosea vaviloviae]
MKSPSFRGPLAYGIHRPMKLRLLAHCLVLALFVTASVLTAFVSPAKAGYGRVEVEATMPMASDMPCCPPDQAGPLDCKTSCPALTFCLAKCFASEPMKAFATLAQPIIVALEMTGDDAAQASRPFEPPARPPRTQGIAGA